MNKVIFKFDVAVLDLLAKKLNFDEESRRELEDAHRLEILSRKRRRQVIRNIKKMMGLLHKAVKQIPEAQRQANLLGRDVTITVK